LVGVQTSPKSGEKRLDRTTNSALKKTLANASLKKSLLQKPFQKICENPLMQEFYGNGF
jgi:hypothetical protein